MNNSNDHYMGSIAEYHIFVGTEELDSSTMPMFLALSYGVRGLISLTEWGPVMRRWMLNLIIYIEHMINRGV